MVARMVQVMGTIVAVALVIAALWGWGQAGRIAENAHRPEMALWAVRSASVSAAAGAQVLLVTCLLGALYRRRAFDEALRLTSGFVCTAGLIGAIVLTLAGS